MLLPLVLWFIFSGVEPAEAHSTEGRARVMLDFRSPVVDDFAYFIEPYVNREKYEGVYEPHMGRFYVMDFHRVERDGRKATVHFEVLDLRNNARFNDHMEFVRGPDDVWQFVRPDGTIQMVFTYIPQWRHVLQLYVQPAGMVAVPLLLLAWGGLRFRQHRKAGRSEGAGPS